jgi:hypothetical protein
MKKVIQKSELKETLERVHVFKIKTVAQLIDKFSLFLSDFGGDVNACLS